MRELKRSIARYLMELNGVKRLNKRDKENPLKTDKFGVPLKTSYFALHWREYLDPLSAYRRELEAKQIRHARAMTIRYKKPFPVAWPAGKHGYSVN